MTMELYVRQLPVGPMKNFAYLLGAKDAKSVAVIDPAWEVETIAKAAADDGKEISCAIVSHCHGDHINGLPELLSQMDLPVYAQAQEIDFSPELRKMGGDALRPSAPGQEVSVGPMTLKLLHTPGHTPGSQCIHVSGSLVSGDTV